MQCPFCNLPNADSATACRRCGLPIGTTTTGAGVGHLPVGTKLRGGAFCVGKILGQGGFGITYLGADTSLGRSVAIKEFFPLGCVVRQRNTVHPAGAMTLGDYQEARQKFLDEARTLAMFQHPGIVQVFTSFEENNTAYMAMELVKGRTLMSLIDELGRVPEAEAVGYISQAGKALEVVHAANLLHRDIKPDNLMVAANARVVLLDFGTAREFASGKTKRMTRMYTEGYAPPEQYQQQGKFGIYTDIYALAATLYHAITGEVPVQALDRGNEVDLPPPHRRAKDVSRSVSDAIMWAMELKAPARPQTVGEFLGALHGTLVPATVVDKDNASPAPQSRHADRYAAQIEQLIKELEMPPPMAPPTSVDGSLNQLRQVIARYTSFALPQQANCPACNAPVLARLSGDWTGQCPICQRGNVAARKLDEDLCAVCGTGHLVRQRLEQPTMFCPVCQGMPLLQEKRKKFGLAIDLWWTCPGCKAEIDVLIGGRAKLVRFSRDPFGFGAKHVGQTFPLESWHQCTPLSQSRLWCSDCGTTFYEFDRGTVTLVGCQHDPRGVARRCLGTPYPRIKFIKLANNVPGNAGNVHCGACRAEFDHDAAAGTLAIVASDISDYPWTGAWRGRPRAVREWSLMSAGKQSLNPGWLCQQCRTEFDAPLNEPGDQMRLFATSSASLAPMVDQCLTFADWHRAAHGVPTTARVRELESELAGLEAIRVAESKKHLEQVEQHRRQIESELSSLFKHCVLDGVVDGVGTVPRLRDGEVVRWQSAAARLKLRTRQSVPYWDIDDEGTLIISSSRIMFDPSMGGRWERPLTKLNYADKEYGGFGNRTVLVTYFDGRQKPIGFFVPDQEVEVTISGHTCQVTLCIDDFLTVLKQQCH